MAELTPSEVNARLIGMLTLIYGRVREGVTALGDEDEVPFRSLVSDLTHYGVTVSATLESPKDVEDAMRNVADQVSAQASRQMAIIIGMMITLFCDLGLAAEEATTPVDVMAFLREAGLRAANDDVDGP